MQAVILAAGLGTRLRPMTYTTPKALVLIGNKTLIEHTLDALPSAIDEIFIVVNYLGEQIKNKIGDSYRDIPIQYVTQEPLTGTGGAMMLLRDRLHDRFLVLNGDDLYRRNDLEFMIREKTSILLSPTDASLQNGAHLNEQGDFIGLIASTSAESYRVCGAYVLDQNYFSIPPVHIETNGHIEFGLPQTLATLAASKPIRVVKTNNWYPVGTPEELEIAQKKYDSKQ